ncbi:MAG TPA: prolyl oligopeptidase family serine peptidase [Steroidobacteraceae bacterium]|nr:prolyl oligopeptidase family serine peptidase [Steroidobacteraceae bacterium]
MNRHVISGLALVSFGAVSGMSGAADDEGARGVLRYPAAERGPTVDTLHGTEVADPYRWMEQDSPALESWVAAQNALAEPYLAAIPARETLKRRLAELWNYEQYGYAWLDEKSRVPVRKGGRYFFVEKSGSQNQGILYWAPSLDAEPRVLVDPNTLSADATASLADFSISPDGRYVAWAVSDGGTDWDTWRVREVETGRDLPDLIGDTKFTGVSWLPDASAFYYSRYPKGADGKGDDQQQVSVYRHRLGSAQADDERVYSITDNPRHNPYATVTEDGRWIVFTVSYGFDNNAIHLRDLSNPDAPVVRLFDRWDGFYDFLGVMDGRLYFRTTQGAPRGRVIAVDPATRAVAEVVPEAPQRLAQASLAGGGVIASYLEDARSRVVLHGKDGRRLRDLQLPGLGTVIGFPDAPSENETFFAYTDYLTPLALYRYDIAKDEAALFRSPAVAFDAAPFVTEQVFFESRDGTRVPMFITRRKDVRMDGSHPTLLYGYGGFDVSLTPSYSAAMAAWLEQGGIYAVANLRGGGEYGADWHDAGTKTKKQNVFDDFIAAAEWLIAKGYTSPAKLAIHGRSNGGLLVGAVMAQRPELFGAALPGVGVLDMLRYHTASANAYAWSSDYGTAEDPDQFRALRAYSPVHNLEPGRCYPPTLVTTADRDDRVVPWHSFKFAAALQHAQGCDKPVLIRIETRAGHGAGKPTWMMVEDWANHWAFLAKALQMNGGGR